MRNFDLTRSDREINLFAFSFTSNIKYNNISVVLELYFLSFVRIKMSLKWENLFLSRRCTDHLVLLDIFVRKSKIMKYLLNRDRFCHVLIHSYSLWLFFFFNSFYFYVFSIFCFVSFTLTFSLTSPSEGETMDNVSAKGNSEIGKVGWNRDVAG